MKNKKNLLEDLEEDEELYGSGHIVYVVRNEADGKICGYDVLPDEEYTEAMTIQELKNALLCRPAKDKECYQDAVFTNMCMVCHPDGHILVLDKKDPSYQGFTFPGGHVQPGEALEDGIRREVKEETGLCLLGVQLCGIYEWIQEDQSRYLVFLYRSDRFEGELKASDEGEVYWVRREDFPGMELAPGMQEVFQICVNAAGEEFFER